MSRRRTGFPFVIVLALLLSIFIGATLWAEAVPRISKESLKSKMNDPEVTIMDVRTEGDWKASEKKIKGAVREDPSDVESWINNYPKDKTIVLYCA